MSLMARREKSFIASLSSGKSFIVCAVGGRI